MNDLKVLVMYIIDFVIIFLILLFLLKFFGVISAFIFVPASQFFVSLKNIVIDPRILIDFSVDVAFQQSKSFLEVLVEGVSTGNWLGVAISIGVLIVCILILKVTSSVTGERNKFAEYYLFPFLVANVIYFIFSYALKDVKFFSSFEFKFLLLLSTFFFINILRSLYMVSKQQRDKQSQIAWNFFVEFSKYYVTYGMPLLLTLVMSFNVSTDLQQELINISVLTLKYTGIIIIKTSLIIFLFYSIAWLFYSLGRHNIFVYGEEVPDLGDFKLYICILLLPLIFWMVGFSINLLATGNYINVIIASGLIVIPALYIFGLDGLVVVLSLILIGVSSVFMGQSQTYLFIVACIILPAISFITLIITLYMVLFIPIFPGFLPVIIIKLMFYTFFGREIESEDFIRYKNLYIMAALGLFLEYFFGLLVFVLLNVFSTYGVNKLFVSNDFTSLFVSFVMFIILASYLGYLINKFRFLAGLNYYLIRDREEVLGKLTSTGNIEHVFKRTFTLFLFILIVLMESPILSESFSSRLNSFFESMGVPLAKIPTYRNLHYSTNYFEIFNDILSKPDSLLNKYYKSFKRPTEVENLVFTSTETVLRFGYSLSLQVLGTSIIELEKMKTDTLSYEWNGKDDIKVTFNFLSRVKYDAPYTFKKAFSVFICKPSCYYLNIYPITPIIEYSLQSQYSKNILTVLLSNSKPFGDLVFIKGCSQKEISVSGGSVETVDNYMSFYFRSYELLNLYEKYMIQEGQSGEISRIRTIKCAIPVIYQWLDSSLVEQTILIGSSRVWFEKYGETYLDIIYSIVNSISTKFLSTKSPVRLLFGVLSYIPVEKEFKVTWFEVPPIEELYECCKDKNKCTSYAKKLETLGSYLLLVDFDINKPEDLKILKGESTSLFSYLIDLESVHIYIPKSIGKCIPELSDFECSDAEDLPDYYICHLTLDSPKTIEKLKNMNFIIINDRYAIPTLVTPSGMGVARFLRVEPLVCYLNPYEIMAYDLEGSDYVRSLICNLIGASSENPTLWYNLVVKGIINKTLVSIGVLKEFNVKIEKIE